MKPLWVFIAEAFVRVTIAFSPFIVQITKDTKNCGLAGGRLKVALELIGVIGSRLLLISWPPLALVKVLEQADRGSKFGLQAPLVFGLIVVALVLIALVLCVPTDWLKGKLPPIVTLLLVEALDFLFQWYALEKLATLIRFP